MHEGMTPSQRELRLTLQKVCLGDLAGAPGSPLILVGLAGCVTSSRTPLYAFLTHASPPSLIRVLPSLALAWVDKPVRKGMGTSVKRAGCRGVLGLAWTPSLSSYVWKSQNQGLYNRVS